MTLLLLLTKTLHTMFCFSLAGSHTCFHSLASVNTGIFETEKKATQSVLDALRKRVTARQPAHSSATQPSKSPESQSHVGFPFFLTLLKRAVL